MEWPAGFPDWTQDGSGCSNEECPEGQLDPGEVEPESGRARAA